MQSQPTELGGESVNLDLLRSIAVLLVFTFHYYEIRNGVNSLFGPHWGLGKLGVFIFFVHTSFVLMWSLERSRLQGSRLFLPFYLRRVMRIYPLSITMVLFAYLFDARWSPINLWQSLTLTQYVFFQNHPIFPPTVGPLWTLPLELEMYLFLPVLFLLLRNRSVIWIFVLWVLSAVLVCTIPAPTEAFDLFRFVPCFLGGILAWRLMRDHRRQRFPGWAWPLAIIAISLVAMPTDDKSHPIRSAFLGLLLGLSIPFFREIRSPRLAAVAKTVAQYSYGIYLTHFPIMVYIMSGRDPTRPRFKHIPPMPVIRHFARPIDAILVVTLTAGASYLLYHAIEKPGIDLGKRMAKRYTRVSRPREQKELIKVES